MIAAGIPLYSIEAIRQLESFAYGSLGLSEAQLMEQAGVAAFICLKQSFPKTKRLTVFCGNGKNGGDGYVLARLAYQEGYQVQVLATKEEHLPMPAAQTYAAARKTGVVIESSSTPIAADSEVIVDALLGIGLHETIQEPFQTLIQNINNANRPVLALDVPSGLDADTGCVLGAAIRAKKTITFIACKQGLLTMDGPDTAGDIEIADLGIDTKHIAPSAFVLSGEARFSDLMPRMKNAHKGQFGHVLVIGGNKGMPGAASLVAHAALRVGAGLVTIACHPMHAQGLAHLPEALIYGVEKPKDLEPLLKKASICVIGPGLGEDSWAQALFGCMMQTKLPLIVDASALRLLAKKPVQRRNWVLTPHPGEASELLGCSIAKVQSNRFHATNLLKIRYNGNVVLKGVGTIVYPASSSVPYLCQAGNPGMASAGMGDTLSGVIAGLMAQQLSFEEASKLGVWLHATAGDQAALSQGERGLLASDLMPYLQKLVNAPFWGDNERS